MSNVPVKTSSSSRSKMLQMVLELGTERCASEDIGPRNG